MTEPVIHSNRIDDILTGITPKIPEFAEAKEVEPIEAGEIPESIEKEIKTEEIAEEKQKVELDSKKEEKAALVESSENDIDEYGNSVEKPKVYTEDQVQAMIRDRLSRGHQAHQPAYQAQVQKAAEDFKADPNSEESWETQLESFVEKTVSKLENKKATQEWQHREQQAQAEFESKFSTSMNRYKDFHDVVRNMPITDAMMVATRELKDPAAFVYAASKLHPDDVRRIASLQNPLQQAVEVGRLEERMRKARNISKAAPPLKATKGDMSEKYVSKPSIEQRIDQYAKVKRR